MPNEGYSGCIALFLKKLPAGHCQYARVRCGKLGSQRDRGALSEVYVRQKIPSSNTRTLRLHFFELHGPILASGSYIYSFVDVVHIPVDPTESKDFSRPSRTDMAGAAGFQDRKTAWLARRCYVDSSQ